jgi:hypothetical protein
MPAHGVADLRAITSTQMIKLLGQIPQQAVDYELIARNPRAIRPRGAAGDHAALIATHVRKLRRLSGRDKNWIADQIGHTPALLRSD